MKIVASSIPVGGPFFFGKQNLAEDEVKKSNL